MLTRAGMEIGVASTKGLHHPAHRAVDAGDRAGQDAMAPMWSAERGNGHAAGGTARAHREDAAARRA